MTGYTYSQLKIRHKTSPQNKRRDARVKINEVTFPHDISAFQIFSKSPREPIISSTTCSILYAGPSKYSTRDFCVVTQKISKVVNVLHPEDWSFFRCLRSRGRVCFIRKCFQSFHSHPTWESNCVKLGGLCFSATLCEKPNPFDLFLNSFSASCRSSCAVPKSVLHNQST